MQTATHPTACITHLLHACSADLAVDALIAEKTALLRQLADLVADGRVVVAQPGDEPAFLVMDQLLEIA